jgi:hypothetical protein
VRIIAANNRVNPERSIVIEIAGFTAMKDQHSDERYLRLLSHLLVGSVDTKQGQLPGTFVQDFRSVSSSDDELASFLAFADLHHVLVRGLEVLELMPSPGMSESCSSFCSTILSSEQQRIFRSLDILESICQKLETAGCAAVVIKSLDHWPDLGSDLDLFSRGRETDIIRTMTKEIGADLLPRSWGDRLAHKWNFRVPELAEAIEIHVGCLGQTGEHIDLARRVTDRAMRRDVAGFSFWVAAPEERVMITTLQRMYRHFYCRLCDIVDTKNLIEAQQLDFDRLASAARTNGIWPGVASFLAVVNEYCAAYGSKIEIPADVLSSAHIRQGVLKLKGQFLRIPIVPEAAGLFLRQVVHAGFQTDMRTVARLSLLPGLAAAALVSYKLSGDDKGIW